MTKSPPKELVAFIDDEATKDSRFKLSRREGRSKYTSIWETWPRYEEVDKIAGSLFQAMLSDLRAQKLPKATYRLTIRTVKGSRRQLFDRSKHFEASLTPEDITPEARCDDCKGSGWYVGVVERYPCPTCGGSGMR